MAKIIDGRKAEITNVGRRFSTYEAFAKAHGYPEAAAESDSSDTRDKPENGDFVTLLASGPHLTGYRRETLWVVEASNGERHIIAEEGLRIMPAEITGITLLPDEPLGGVLREYREVKRWANVGDFVTFGGKSAGITPHKPYAVIERDESGAKFRDDDGDMRWDSHIADAGFGRGVLEPTDVLVINMNEPRGKRERLRMVDRKAAVGDRVIVTKTAPKYTPFSVGECGVVTGETGWVDADVNVDFGSKRYFIGPSASSSEYCVLEPVDSAQPAPALSDLPAQDQAAANIAALTLKVTELEKRNNALEARILALETETALAYVEVACGPVDSAPPSFAERAQRKASATSAKSPQMVRDEIVERAKADVSDLRKFSGTKIPNDFVSFWPKTSLPHVYNAMHTVEFVVNPAKRTVVAIIRCMYEGLTTRGIAKCAPGDVFNSHIGRAIALHRALGLEVPAEYVNAPAPEDVRVGDVIKYHTGTRGPLTVRDPVSNTRVETFLSTAHDHFDSLTILDDSREGLTPSPRKEAA